MSKMDITVFTSFETSLKYVIFDLSVRVFYIIQMSKYD